MQFLVENKLSHFQQGNPPPGAQCVEPVWSMSKEEFEESQRQAVQQQDGKRSCLPTWMVDFLW